MESKLSLKWSDKKYSETILSIVSVPTLISKAYIRLSTVHAPRFDTPQVRFAWRFCGWVVWLSQPPRWGPRWRATRSSGGGGSVNFDETSVPLTLHTCMRLYTRYVCVALQAKRRRSMSRSLPVDPGHQNRRSYDTFVSHVTLQRRS